MLENRYEITEHLGDGAFGAVKLATETTSGNKYACKIIQVDKMVSDLMLANVKKEIAIMRFLHHPHVVTLHNVFYKSHTLYLIVDLCRGGDVYELLAPSEANPHWTAMTEPVARKYFQQLILGVEYCHSRGVCHRDLKPENLLLDSAGNLMISDFGLSTLNTKGRTATQCGTPNYVAPEVITQPDYDAHKADIWSCGVLLFVLLSASMPFEHECNAELYKLIEFAAYEWPIDVNVSKRAKLLVKKMLQPEVASRYSTRQIKADPWFSVDFNEASASAACPVAASSRPRKKESGDKVMNAFELLSRVESLHLAGMVDQEIRQRGWARRFASSHSLAELTEGVLEEVQRCGFVCVEQQSNQFSCVPTCRQERRLLFWVEFLKVMDGVNTVTFRPKADVGSDVFDRFYNGVYAQIGPIYDASFKEQYTKSPLSSPVENICGGNVTKGPRRKRSVAPDRISPPPREISPNGHENIDRDRRLAAPV